MVRRWLFSTACIASLFLLVATSFAWIESYRYAFTLHRYSARDWLVASGRSSNGKQTIDRNWGHYELTLFPGSVFLTREVFHELSSTDSSEPSSQGASTLSIWSPLRVPGESVCDHQRVIEGKIFTLKNPRRFCGFGFANELPAFVPFGPFGSMPRNIDQDHEIYQEFLAPFWAFAVLFSAVPVAWIALAIKRHRSLEKSLFLGRCLSPMNEDSRQKRAARHPIRRKLFGVMSTVSLMLCVALVIAWIESYSYLFSLERNILRTWSGQEVPFRLSDDVPIGKWSRFELLALPGSIYLRREVAQGQPPYSLNPDREDTSALHVQSIRLRSDELSNYRAAPDGTIFSAKNPWLHGGFGFARFRDPKGNSAKTYSIRQEILAPFWALAALFAAAPTGWMTFALRRRRIESHLCASCGYNLTANISGVCPECGTTTSLRRSRGGGVGG